LIGNLQQSVHTREHKM